MIVNFEQTNARGEGSRPRVDLNALVRAPGPRRPGRRDATRPAGRGRRDPRPRGQGPGNRPHRRLAGSPVGPDAVPPARALSTHPEIAPMQVTVQIHEAWLARPEDLRRVMALLAGLEVPPPSGAGPRQTARPRPPTPRTWRSRSTRKSMPRPGRRPAGPGRRLGAADRRAGRGRADGRPAVAGLGVEADPGHEGVLIGFGKKKGLRSKIVEWTPQQVAAAYRFARGRLQSTTR